jgi:hypothetical protein
VGEIIMIPYFRKLEEDDIGAMLDLAFKAVYERGLADTEFDKQAFNFTVKNWFVKPTLEPLGIFLNDQLIGFAMLAYDKVFYSGRMRASIDLIHITAQHRDSNYYELLLKFVFKMCDDKGIDLIRTSSINYGLDSNKKESLLYSNGFKQTDTMWERDAS